MAALLIQLSASALTMLSSWFYDNKSTLGPIIGIVSQVPWWTIMFEGSLWGLLPVNAAMLGLHIRNLWKWSRSK